MDFLFRASLAILYVLWLPAMLLARMFGRDPLQLRKPATSSYWLVRSSPSSRESYFCQDSESEGRPALREGNETGPHVGAGRSPMLARLFRAISGAFAKGKDEPPGMD